MAFKGWSYSIDATGEKPCLSKSEDTIITIDRSSRPRYLMTGVAGKAVGVDHGI